MAFIPQSIDQSIRIMRALCDEIQPIDKSESQTTAIAAAAEAIRKQYGECRAYRVLSYQGRNKAAFLWRDENTINALAVGLECLQLEKGRIYGAKK